MRLDCISEDIAGSNGIFIRDLPLDSDGDQSIDDETRGQHLDEVGDRTHYQWEYPSTVHEVGVSEGNGEDGHKNVGERQIQQMLPQVSGGSLLQQQ